MNTILYVLLCHNYHVKRVYIKAEVGLVNRSEVTRDAVGSEFSFPSHSHGSSVGIPIAFPQDLSIIMYYPYVVH